MAINGSFRTLTTNSLEGVVSSKNYLNSSFENGTVSGWNKFTVTLSGNIPTSAPTIGSASSITDFQTDNIFPLSENYSLNVKSISTPWLAGQGFISDAFTLDKSDSGNLLTAYFDYKIFTGSSSINFSGILNQQSFAIFIYNETLETWIQPDGFLGFSDTLDSNRMIVNFTSSNANTQYRFAFLCINATSGFENINISFDNFVLTRSAELSGNQYYPVKIPIVNNQTSVNTGVFVDVLNSSGFTIDYSEKRNFNQLSLQKNNAFANNNLNLTVFTIAEQTDGKILLGGAFDTYGGVSGRDFLVRLNSNGTVDTAFCAEAVDGPKFGGSIFKIVVQPDGKILVGGQYGNYRQSQRNYLVRLNSDGTVDTAFCAQASDGGKFSDSVRDIQLQSDGRILISGDFLNYNGVAGRNCLIRLNSDGTLDTAFCAQASDGGKFNGPVRCIKIQSNGGILVGGSFTNYPGEIARNYLIRLIQSTGSVDGTFCTIASDFGKFNAQVFAIEQQSNGRILVGGSFTNYPGATSRNYLIGLQSAGNVDNTFCGLVSDLGKFNADVRSIAIEPDDKILVGGSFTNYAGTTGRNRLIRLNSGGTVDTVFCNQFVDGGKISTARVNIVVTNSSYSVYFGGFFSSYDTSFNYFVPLTFQLTGTSVSQIETGRIIGHIDLYGYVTSSDAYPPLGSGGVTLDINAGSGNIQYTSDNLYAYPNYELIYGSLNLLVKNL